MKFTEEQKELIALLPQNAKDYKLTDSAKLVWGHLIFMYGTDFAKDNGFVYRTNLALMQDTGIKSEMTILKSIRQLEEKGIIATKRGKRGEASEYVLLDEKYSNEEKNIVIKYSNKSENYSNKIEDMELTINDLMKRIEQLEQEIIVLKKYSNEIKKYSTDTESESDKEKESINKEKLIDEKQGDVEYEWNDDEELDFDDNDEMKLYGWGNAQMTSNNKTISSNNEVMKTTATSDTFGKWMNRINGLLDCYFSAKSKEGIQSFEEEINNQLISINSKSDTLTDKQRSAVDAICNRYISLNEQKAKYLQGDSNDAVSNATIPSNNSKNNSGGVAAASDIYTDDEWAMKVEEAFNAEQPQTTPKESAQKPHERLSDDEWNDYVIARFAAADKAENEAKKAASNEWQFDINTIPF